MDLTQTTPAINSGPEKQKGVRPVLTYLR